ncbi:hypothetical protein AMS68_005654 [Peltaster fructicola]|uniref:Mitochondrial glyco protein n=1 Tax=Peltaster fructicola TaxID=286661 RepID=A0A6H0XZG0_9PEZI|nr:hypothetical protein AMS68_005654 [Peltaster fructicola]
MFAARIVARAAPRFASRTLTASSRITIASTSRQVQARLQVPSTVSKYFSTSRPRFDASAQELAAKLENELSLENEGSEGVATLSEENVKSFLEGHDWELVDVEGESGVKLTRKYDDETIEVQFTVADFPPQYGEEDEMDEALLDEEDLDGQSGGANSKAAVAQGRTSGGNIKVGQNDNVAPGDRDELRDAEDENAGSQQPFPASVTVNIRRQGKQGVLRFELVAEDGEFSVQAITPLTDAEAAAAEQSGYTGAEKSWNGPPFQQLDEELQSFFENYLSERGIDSALALIVPDYIDVKEQKEYLGWLKKVRDFVD